MISKQNSERSVATKVKSELLLLAKKINHKELKEGAKLMNPLCPSWLKKMSKLKISGKEAPLNLPKGENYEESLKMELL